MLLLIFGPSGSGKTEIIRLLVARRGLEYITPDTTRALRRNEGDKVAVSADLFRLREAEGHYIWINQLFETKYGTPRRPVERAIADLLPTHVLDFPIEEVAKAEALTGYKCGILIMPPSAETLRNRLVLGHRSDRVSPALAQYARYLERLQAGVPSLIGKRVVINENIEQAFQDVLEAIDSCCQ